VYDVLIVGAGPAGSSTAYYLAARGFHVLLVEKRSFPREKPCGDGLTPRALAALKNMGLSHLWNSLTKVHGIRLIEYRHGDETMMPFSGRNAEPPFGGVLRRFDLDDLLSRAATACGANLLTNTTVGGVAVRMNGKGVEVWGEHNGEPFKAASRFVVLADGSAGTLSNHVCRGPVGQPRMGFAMRQYFKGHAAEPYAFEVHMPLMVNNLPSPGYGWVFPVSGDTLNIGVGLCFGNGAPLERVNLREAFSGFVERLRLSGRLESCVRCAAPAGASLRIGLAAECTIAPCVVQVGDAAGVINPFTGEGIAYALESGELAAEAIDVALKRGSYVAERYPELLNLQYRRFTHLRTELPDLYGLARLYVWHNGKLGNKTKDPISTGVRSVISDHERTNGAMLHSLLRNESVITPSLRAALESVEERVLEEIGTVSSVFGELAYYTRCDDHFLPSFSALHILSALECLSALDQETIEIAAAWELFLAALFFHSQCGDPYRIGNGKSSSVAAILMGDVMVARVFNVLNRCDPVVARAMSAAILKQSDEIAVVCARAGRRNTRLRSPRPVAILQQLATVVSVALSRTAASAVVVRLLRDWSEQVATAVQILHGIWIDHCPDSSNDWRPLYLTLRGMMQQPTATAIARGVNVISYLTRYYDTDENPQVLEEAQLAIIRSRSLLDAFDEADRRIDAANVALDGLNGMIDAERLRAQTANVRTALKTIRVRADAASSAALR
jgi:geranylgeranyl reductase family protein